LIQNFVSLAKSSTKEHMLTAILQMTPELTAELIERVKADLFNHIRRAPLSDDITMIAVHRKA
jgi:hypothetical protein